MSFKKQFRLIIFFEILFISLSFILLYKISENNEKIFSATQEQLLMFKTADRLRQSSDDLTHFARTYVITSNDKFKEQYLDTLAIRNGDKERPYNYHSIYWDLSKNIRDINHKNSEKISLQSIFDSLPFSEKELKKLEISKAYSDALVSIELQAFNAMKGVFIDSFGKYTLKGEVNQKFAIELLHSNDYYLAKERIMKPIDDFILELQSRTENEVFKIHEKSQTIFVLFGIVISILIIGNYYIYRLIKAHDNRKVEEKNNLLLKQKVLNSELKKRKKDLVNLNTDLELKVEERTKEQNVLLSLFDKGDSILFKWNNDEKWSVSYVSQSVEKVLGYDYKSFLNNQITYTSCIHKDDKQKFMDEVSKATNHGDVTYFKHNPYRVITKNGEIKWIMDYTVVIKDEKSISHYLGYLLDITAEKKNEYELLEFKNSLFSDSKAVMLLIEPSSGEIVDCNNAALKFYGYSYDELTNKFIFEINQLSKDEIKKEIENAQKEKRNHFYFRHKLKNGTIKDVEIHSGPISLKGQDLLYSVIHDITEQKKQEKIINEQSKLVSMGEMIGNIAHQWRQPLSVISTASSGMQMQKEYGKMSDETFNKTCETITNTAQYLSKTIDDFRDFIKGDRQKVSFILNEDIRSFLRLIEGSINTNEIKVIENFGEEVSITGYPNELVQCFINIYNNAKDALKDISGDKLFLISTEVIEDTVVVKFTDNAHGIEQAVIDKIFEPYFTTKHQSQGTGLGLHMTYNLIVDGMNGTIEANNVSYEYENKTYTGAEFTITLPLN